MKNQRNLFGYAAALCSAIILLTGCSGTSELADNSIIQKRRYTKGYHLNIKSPFDARSGETVAARDGEQDIEPLEPVSAVLTPEVELEEIPSSLTASLVTAGEPTTTATQVHDASSERRHFFSDVWKFRQSTSTASALTAQDEYTIPPRTHGLAIAGFVAPFVGIFFAGLIMGVLAIVFSAIALGSINSHPDKYKGKGLAIAGLILGVILVFAMLVLLASL